ncbi:MAG: type II secretion system F family protein [Bacilli bacterium]|nr:type II secretion system F family protein [Bacilli bacterium]
MINNLKKKLDYLDLKISPTTYYLFKIVTTFMIFGFLMFVQFGYVIAPVCSIVYFCLFDVILLDMNINSRIMELEDDAISYFRVFLLSLKGGRNIRKAIEVTNSVVDNEMTKEFEKMLHNVKLGRTLDESLDIMIDKIPSITIGNILVSIKEASRMGNNLSNGINVQLESLRLNREKKLLNKYRMIPFKMFILFLIFMLFVFFFILLFNYIF